MSFLSPSLFILEKNDEAITLETQGNLQNYKYYSTNHHSSPTPYIHLFFKKKKVKRKKGGMRRKRYKRIPHYVPLSQVGFSILTIKFIHNKK